MSNEHYNRGVRDAIEVIENGYESFEAVDRMEKLILPEPKPGELWKEDSGHIWWIFEDKGKLMGRLLFDNMDGGVQPVYGDDPVDNIDFRVKIY